MLAQIKIAGQSIECELEFPFKDSPILISGPVGMQYFSSTVYSNSNARIYLNKATVLPDEFLIDVGKNTYKFICRRQSGCDVWGRI